MPRNEFPHSLGRNGIERDARGSSASAGPAGSPVEEGGPL